MLRSMHKCPAYWPRSSSSSTVDYNDRLETCFALFTNPETPPSEDQINVVFSHGSQCSKEVFYFHIDLLYQKLGPRLGKCISIDCVTHGDSAVVNHNKLGTFAPWDDVARDIGLVVHHCIDKLGLVGHNVFVGHSMSGMCGMVLAAFEPALFDCIVPLDPIFNNNDTIGPALEGQLKLVSWTKRGKDKFDNLAACEQYYRQRFCRGWDPRVVDYFAGAAGVEMPDGTARTKANMANQMSAYLSSNPLFGSLESFLKLIRTPVLILYGQETGKLSAGDPSFLASVVMDGTSMAVNSGHNFPFHEPELTVDLIVPFILEKCDAAAKWHRPALNAEQATQWQFAELDRTLKVREEYVLSSYFSKKMPKL